MKTAAVHTRMIGANPGTRLAAADRLPGVANYFLGSAGNWQSDVPGFGSIRYSGVYSGIDLVFHGEERRLEYDFIVAPHADAGAIRLEISGHKSLRIDDNGDLVIATDAGEIRWKKPEAYQETSGQETHGARHSVPRPFSRHIEHSDVRNWRLRCGAGIGDRSDAEILHVSRRHRE